MRHRPANRDSPGAKSTRLHCGEQSNRLGPDLDVANVRICKSNLSACRCDPRSIMTALLVILWTLIGFATAAVIGTELGPLFGFQNIEGSSAIFGVLFAGPMGAGLGGIAGFWLSQKLSGDLRRQKLAFGLPLLAIGVLALSGFLFESIRTWDRLDSYGDTYSIGFQVRLPAGAPSPADVTIGMELRSAKENPECSIHAYPHGLTQQGDRYILSGRCVIRYAERKRILAMRIGGGANHLFTMRVAARPSAAVYSEWFATDEIQDTAPGSKPRAPRPEERLEIRYDSR